jgi:lipid-binding SYLF domain-containing protein
LKGDFNAGATLDQHSYRYSLASFARDGKGGWTAPAGMRVECGSVGLQVGGAASDVVLLVMNKSGIVGTLAKYSPVEK